MAFTDEEINDMFTYHLDPTKAPNYKAINEAAENLVRVIVANTRPSADQSCAIRHVRDARMTANAAVALDGRF